SLNHADVGLAQRVQELLANITAGVLLDVGEEPAVFLMGAEVVRESEAVQRAANDGLWFVALGDGHGGQAMLAGRDPAVAADEVDVLCTLHEELSQDGVVVVILGNVAVGALLGLALAPDRVR